MAKPWRAYILGMIDEMLVAAIERPWGPV